MFEKAELNVCIKAKTEVSFEHDLGSYRRVNSLGWINTTDVPNATAGMHNSKLMEGQNVFFISKGQNWHMFTN